MKSKKNDIPEDLLLSKKTGFTLIEINILRLMAKDKDTYEIADAIGRSVRTIETIRQRMKRKAKVNTLPALILKAASLSLIPSPIRPTK